MSEALPLMTAVLPSQGSGQPVLTQGGPAPAGAGQGFPALFAAMNVAEVPTTLLPASLPLLPAELLADPAFAPLEAGVASAELPQELQMFSAQLQQAGNDLPQLNWTGLVAFADGETAQVVQLEGDENGVTSTRPIVAREVPGAVQRAQPFALATDEQALVPMTQELQLQQQLANRDLLTGLRLDRAVSVDTAQPLLQSAVPHTSGNGQFAALLDGTVMAGVTARGDTATQTMQLPVHHPQWGQQVGERVHWMINQNLQQADLRLNPPELGSLEVRIQVQGDQTSVNFSSPHASVREALDAALPRLREMLQEAGLSLGNTNVSDHALAQRDSGQSGGAGQRGGSGGESGVVSDDATLETHADGRRGVGLVDLYA